MRLKHKFVHTNIHTQGKKYIQETHVGNAHMHYKHTRTHSRVAKAATNM